MTFIFTRSKKTVSRKTVSSYKQEVLRKQGRDQFKALAKKGLGIPVELL